MGYQPQIPLLTGGGVEGFHRQAAVDEGNDDAAVRDFLQPVNQTDVAIVVSFSAPVLHIKYYILFIINQPHPSVSSSPPPEPDLP